MRRCRSAEAAPDLRLGAIVLGGLASALLDLAGISKAKYDGQQ